MLPLLLMKRLSIFIDILIKVFFISFFICLGGCVKREDISEADAQRVAMVKLEEYAKRNEIPVAKFSATEIRFNNDVNVWEIYFQSTGNPKHHVVILVDKSGGAKTTFILDKPT